MFRFARAVIPIGDLPLAASVPNLGALVFISHRSDLSAMLQPWPHCRVEGRSLTSLRSAKELFHHAGTEPDVAAEAENTGDVIGVGVHPRRRNFFGVKSMLTEEIAVLAISACESIPPFLPANGSRFEEELHSRLWQPPIAPDMGTCILCLPFHLLLFLAQTRIQHRSSQSVHVFCCWNSTEWS